MIMIIMIIMINIIIIIIIIVVVIIIIIIVVVVVVVIVMFINALDGAVISMLDCQTRGRKFNSPPEFVRDFCFTNNPYPAKLRQVN